MSQTAEEFKEQAIANIRRALALWDAGYKFEVSGTDIEKLLEVYDAALSLQHSGKAQP